MHKYTLKIVNKNICVRINSLNINNSLARMGMNVLSLIGLEETL